MLLGADGKPLNLRELRGRPLLLFVFTTFDDTCQLALMPLERVLRSHPELSALGIAVQPEPQQLLALYRDALGVSFPLAYEPDSQVVAGKTMLGPIQTVPTYVLLDAQGRIAARHTGALTAAALEELFALVAP
jgi:peroxiredoxin